MHPVGRRSIEQQSTVGKKLSLSLFLCSLSLDIRDLANGGARSLNDSAHPLSTLHPGGCATAISAQRRGRTGHAGRGHDLGAETLGEVVRAPHRQVVAVDTAQPLWWRRRWLVGWLAATGVTVGRRMRERERR